MQYEANTLGVSTFAVVIREVETDAGEPLIGDGAADDTDEEFPDEVPPDEEAPDFGFVVGLLAVLCLLVVLSRRTA